MKHLFVLGGLLLATGFAARAQNPVVPGQSPLRRLNPPAGAPPVGQPGPGLPGGAGLDSLRTLSGRYEALASETPSLVLFDLTVGYAQPLGTFADLPASGPTTPGGGATRGGTVALTAAYLFRPTLGVFGTLGGGIIGVREQAVYNRLELTDATARDIEYGKRGWSFTTFAVGPQLTLPLGRPKKLALDLRPGVGFVYVVSPRYGASFTDTTGERRHEYVSSVGALALAWQLGAALRVPLTERLGLRLGADYYYARPSFSNYNPNTSLPPNDDHTPHPVMYWQLAAGLVVRFE